MRFELAAALVAAALALSPAAVHAADKAPVQKPGEGYTDSSITSSIKGQIDKDKGLAPLNLRVDTIKGVVKLSGLANTKAESDKAVAIAKGTTGVARVQNDIRVTGK
jgi:osmotically-inducible protein OsmY